MSYPFAPQKKFMDLEGILKKYSVCEEDFLKILKNLKEKLGYKTIDGDADVQIDAIIRLSKINNIYRVIKVLGKSGYYLSRLDERKLDCWDVARIEDIAELGIEKYLYRSYYPLKDMLKISRTNSSMVSNIIKLSKMGDDAFKVIDALAKTGYTLETVSGFKWLDIYDVELVSKLMGEGLERYLDALDKTKDALGYKAYGQKTYGQNYHAIRNGSKIEYLAEHANDILRVLEIKGDVWRALDALVKTGYKIDFSGERIFKNEKDIPLLEDLANSDISKYLEVFTALKKSLGYKTVKVSDNPDDQVNRILNMSKIKGNILKAIDALAQTGYKLVKLGGKEWLLYNDSSSLESIINCGVDNYLKTFKSLKENLGYKTVCKQLRSNYGTSNSGSYEQIEKVIEISKLGNACEAIEALAGLKSEADAYGKVDKLPPFGVYKKYKINNNKGITQEDMEIIRSVSNKLWKKLSEEIRPCFYKESSEKFIEYFNSLNINEKKSAIRAIFKCDKASNEEIIQWLDTNETGLVREVGLE